MRKGWVLLALLGLATVKPAGAAPNFLGSTGLLLTPTADVLRLREWNAHVHGTDDFTTYGAAIGIFENLEVGVTAFDPDIGNDDALINAKYRLLAETATAPAIAVGAVDITDELEVDPSIYLVISKALGMTGGSGAYGGYQLRGHLGVGDGIYDDIIAGLDLIFNPRLLLMAEYDGNDFNFGARLGLTPEVRVDLAVLDGNFGAGISFNAAF
jgi:hypothetical protein